MSLVDALVDRRIPRTLLRRLLRRCLRGESGSGKSQCEYKEKIVCIARGVVSSIDAGDGRAACAESQSAERTAGHVDGPSLRYSPRVVTKEHLGAQSGLTSSFGAGSVLWIAPKATRLCPLWVIFNRSSRFSLPVNVHLSSRADLSGGRSRRRVEVGWSSVIQTPKLGASNHAP